MVRLGNTEWLLLKFTPIVRTVQSVGESVAFTEPARRPSATKMIALRGGFAGLCPDRTATMHAVQRAKSQEQRAKTLLLSAPCSRLRPDPREPMASRTGV